MDRQVEGEAPKPKRRERQVKWKALSRYFRARRGEGVAYKTIQVWQAMGMPYQQPSSHRTWFDPEACWQWYLEQFRVGGG